VTKRITISVPDDVAEHLEGVGSRRVSGYVTDAIRQVVRREAQLRQLDEVFRRAGAQQAPDRERAERFLDDVAAWKTTRPTGAGSPR
jgi:metal-responsive CopG/Arc/MetJ family transcriptional regulator